MQHGNTVRWVHSRSLQSDILARCRCHHGDCSAFRSLELAKCHWPLQAALSGSLIKAPGFAGGYLQLGADIAQMGYERWEEFKRNSTTHLFEEFKKTCDMLIVVGARLEQRRAKNNED